MVSMATDFQFESHLNHQFLMMLLDSHLFCIFSTFLGNIYEGSAGFLTSNGQSDHSSALLAYRFPVELSGFNYFGHNLGGGIILINSRMCIFGEMLVERNVAMFGGGISLDDSCLVSIYLA